MTITIPTKHISEALGEGEITIPPQPEMIASLIALGFKPCGKHAPNGYKKRIAHFTFPTYFYVYTELDKLYTINSDGKREYITIDKL